MNAFGFSLIAALNAALDAAVRDSACTSLVLSGNKRAFSAGFDLGVMGPKGDADLRAELLLQGAQLTERLYAFPKPLVVAGTGHGLALGAILLLAGDLRVGPAAGQKGKFGLNEVAIGMTLPLFGIELARARCPTATFEESVLRARVYDSVGAVRAGFLDLLADSPGLDAVVAAAAAEAEKIGAYVRQPAFAQQKLLARAATLAIVRGEIRGMEERVAARRAKAAEAGASRPSRL